jgi:purine nucleoside permease
MRARRTCLALLACASAMRSGFAAEKPIEVKVVVVTMFERGADSGDQPGEFQLWVEREHLDQVIPLPGGYHHLRLNSNGVLGLLTGIGTAKASASVMALGLDPRFDLTHAYWLVAGIGGGDPADVSLGSVVWADRVLDGDLGYEIDAREIPKGWSTGYVPLRRSEPFAQPVRNELEGELYQLNTGLVRWAYELTKRPKLPDDSKLREARARYRGLPNAQRPPFVAEGDTISASTFWHGELLDRWANEWVKYYTKNQGNYMISAMEDSGTLQALTFLKAAGRVDLNRVLVLRAASNYDRPPPGVSAAENLQTMNSGGYSAFLQSLNDAELVGDMVVDYLVKHWSGCRDHVPGAPPQ